MATSLPTANTYDPSDRAINEARATSTGVPPAEVAIQPRATPLRPSQHAEYVGTKFNLAAESGTLEEMQYWANKGDVTTRHRGVEKYWVNNALRWSVHRAARDKITYLVREFGADLEWGLPAACCDGNLDMAKWLVEAGAKNIQEAYNAVMDADGYNPAVVDWLEDEHGMTEDHLVPIEDTYDPSVRPLHERIALWNCCATQYKQRMRDQIDAGSVPTLHIPWRVPAEERRRVNYMVPEPDPVPNSHGLLLQEKSRKRVRDAMDALEDMRDRLGDNFPDGVYLKVADALGEIYSH